MAVEKRADIFSAIGVAAGLGNAVRFPALVARYGGAFAAVYAVCIFFVCRPLLKAELEWGAKRRPRMAVLSFVAALNAAYTGVYYGGIIQQLGNAALSFTPAGEFSLSAALLFCVVPWIAAYALIRGGARALSLSGKFSLGFFAVALLPLVAAGAGRFGFAFQPAAMLSPLIWAEALCQAMLSLSLAQWVMPSFAAEMGNVNFSRMANIITAVNFAVCLMSAVAVLSLGGTDSENAAQLFSALSVRVWGGDAAGRIFCFVCLMSLVVVAVQSAASLIYPLACVSQKRCAALCLVAGMLSMLFAYGNDLVAACDFIACTVVAPAVATAECIALMREGSAVIRRLCFISFLGTAVFSLFGAAAIGHSPWHIMGAIAVYALIASICILTNGHKGDTIKLWKNYRLCAMRLKREVLGHMPFRRRRRRRNSPQT